MADKGVKKVGMTGRSMLETIAQLEHRVLLLERERASQLYSKRHEFRGIFCSLEEAELRMHQQRKAEKKELGQQIARIKVSVRSFQRMLTDMKPGPAFVEKLKCILEETEASILAFKERQREIYESLLLEERKVSQEVQAFERKLEAWLSGGGAAGHLTTNAREGGGGGERGGGRATALPPAVLAFERFLQQTGGARGGWDDYDHNAFLRIRNKYPGKAGFLEAVTRELPSRSDVEIQSHDQWYSEYCSLLQAKKEAIQEWRRKRAQLAHPTQLEGTGRVEEEKQRQKETAISQERLERERRNKQEKLHAWKIQQELKSQKAEEERMQVKEELVKRKEKEKRRQAELRLKVKCYQQEKERARQAAMEAMEVRRAEEREIKIAATKEIEKFRERDLRAAAEKREKLKEKETEKAELERRLNKLKEQVEVAVPRDPDRLLKLTAGWQERKKAASMIDLDRAGVGVGSRDLPRRAVPAWRQGL